MPTLVQDLKAQLGIFESDADQVHGLLAEFPDPGALLHAAEAVREDGGTAAADPGGGPPPAGATNGPFTATSPR